MQFLQNKYTKWYLSIIQNAKTQNREKFKGIYYEKHHITPRALFKSKENKDTILLTAKEHYICHLLLTRMTTGTFRHSMLVALHYMQYRHPNQQRITSKLFSIFKETISKSISVSRKGKTHTQKTKEKIKNSHIGIPHSEERKRNISKNHADVSGNKNPMFGQERSLIWRTNHSKSMKGKLIGSKNYMFGRTHSDEAKEKIKNAWIKRKSILQDTSVIHVPHN